MYLIQTLGKRMFRINHGIRVTLIWKKILKSNYFWLLRYLLKLIENF